MGKLILVRHGKSLWNVKNVFTGWTDIDLAPEGIEEARKAGELIKSNLIEIDLCFSSYLKRAIRTAWIILETAGMMHVDTRYSWKLNERHYGDWQGKNKDEVLKEVGEAFFLSVRRGYDTPPPCLSNTDRRNPEYDSNYKALDTTVLPLGESLKDTSKRVVNYFFEAIAPELAKGKTVLIAAHGNSLRALIEYLEHISSDEIAKVTVATGVPHMYTFDNKLNITEHYPLR
ncbi:2,3-bisphosphoglycerate-dependent phosphoglycerate mutase [Zobellia uliginosa]|uniref:2,3-bisphosphoglycerate-dependent phosphoglycerate mutase n=1 Tax=Zobellia uliginosa TaxID=143224 RepID=A0ABY1KNF1_9FLAO|nr:2,3-bisphosphoglycerate-dependent phosphoglycerate mutase [Zobellia uliginosa]SIS53330.1 2,3-bisphosphoglycerate-dependent phosphoglycerate mutase [Zobellia uliginosa]